MSLIGVTFILLLEARGGHVAWHVVSKFHAGLSNWDLFIFDCTKSSFSCASFFDSQEAVNPPCHDIRPSALRGISSTDPGWWSSPSTSCKLVFACPYSINILTTIGHKTSTLKLMGGSISSHFIFSIVCQNSSIIVEVLLKI